MDRVLLTFIVVFVYVGTALGTPLRPEIMTFLNALNSQNICKEFPSNGLIQGSDLPHFFDRCGNPNDDDAFLEIVCGNIANLSSVMCDIAKNTTVEVKQADVFSHFESMKNDTEQTTCESGAFLRLIRESKSTTEECIKTCKNFTSGCSLFRAMMDSAAATINETKDFREVDMFIHKAQTFFPYPPLSTMDAGGPLEQCIMGHSSVCAAVKELAVLLAQSGAPPVSYEKFMSSIANTKVCGLFPLNVTLQAPLRNLTLQAPIWASLANNNSCEQICNNNEASTICKALVVGLDSLISALKNPTATSSKKTTETTSNNPDGTKNVTTTSDSSTETPAPGIKPSSPTTTPAPGNKPRSPTTTPAPGNKPSSPTTAPGNKPSSPTTTTAPGNKTNSSTETPAPGNEPSSPTTTTAPGVNNHVTTNATKATSGSPDASTKIPNTIPPTTDNTRATTSSPSSSTPSTVEATTDDESEEPNNEDRGSNNGEENSQEPNNEDRGSNNGEENSQDGDDGMGPGNDDNGLDSDEVHPDEEGGSNAAVKTIDDDDESAGGISFMSYFLVGTVLCVAGYIVFHNKQKIIALIVEGKSVSGGSRRPSSKEYRRLKTEDVMPSLERSTTSTNYVY